MGNMQYCEESLASRVPTHLDFCDKYACEDGVTVNKCKNKLLLREHPDKGGNLEVTKEINADYDCIETYKKNKCDGPAGMQRRQAERQQREAERQQREAERQRQQRESE